MQISDFVVNETIPLLELDEALQNKVKYDSNFFPWLESVVKIPLENADAQEWYAKASKELILLVEQVSRIPRSKLLAQSMTKVPELSSAVPLFMSYYDFKYSEWKRNMQLTTFLTEPLTFLLTPYKIPPANILKEYSLKAGDPKKYIIKKVGNPLFDSYPRMLRLMLLQHWVYNPNIRSDKMILDPENWDNIPEKLSEM